MQDHRQPVSAGKFELRDVEALLPGTIEAGYEMIQADLADRDQLRVVAMRLEGLGQSLQVGVGGRVDVQGVDAQRVGQAVPMSQPDQ